MDLCMSSVKPLSSQYIFHQNNLCCLARRKVKSALEQFCWASWGMRGWLEFMGVERTIKWDKGTEDKWRMSYEITTLETLQQSLLDFYKTQLPLVTSQGWQRRWDKWKSFVLVPSEPTVTCLYRLLTGAKESPLCLHSVSAPPQHIQEVCLQELLRKGMLWSTRREGDQATPMRSLYVSWVTLWTEEITVPLKSVRFPVAPDIRVSGKMDPKWMRLQPRCHQNQRPGQCCPVARRPVGSSNFCLAQALCLLTFCRQSAGWGRAAYVLLIWWWNTELHSCPFSFWKIMKGEC